MLPALLLSVVAIVLLGGLFYQHILTHKLRHCERNDLLGQLESMPKAPVSRAANEYLNPQLNQLGTEPADIWGPLRIRTIEYAKQVKASKAHNLQRRSTPRWYKAPSFKLSSLFARRRTNVLCCPNSEKTPINQRIQYFASLQVSGMADLAPIVFRCFARSLIP
jgi:hypothetical protein